MHKGSTWGRKATRRGVLQGLAATSLLLPQMSRQTFAAAPAASKVTPELIEAAKKEGKACLLYTSPSPRDGLLSRMPSSA